MPDFTKLAEQYIATWNETDPSARRALIGQVWSEGGRYIDPLADVTGPDATLAGPDYALTDTQRLFLFARAETIFGGSNEIQRNIVAERGLGLPRG